jgi:ABC-type transport system substrate-binding protein
VRRLRWPHQLHVLLPLTMNLGVPPFDDVHVRRAVGLAIDKAALVEMLSRPPFGAYRVSLGEAAAHLAPDSLEESLLRAFEPYSHDLVKARAQMRLSAYDRAGDGRCGASACRGVTAIVNTNPVRPEQARAIRNDLLHLGIDLKLEYLEIGAFFARLADPPNGSPWPSGRRGGKDFSSGSSWFPPCSRVSAPTTGRSSARARLSSAGGATR